MAVLVSGKEEEGSQANLLYVHPHKDVLDGLGEEQTTSLTGRCLIELPSEEILPHLVEQEERETCKAIDDRRDEHVSQG